MSGPRCRMNETKLQYHAIISHIFWNFMKTFSSVRGCSCCRRKEERGEIVQQPWRPTAQTQKRRTKNIQILFTEYWWGSFFDLLLIRARARVGGNFHSGRMKRGKNKLKAHPPSSPRRDKQQTCEGESKRTAYSSKWSRYERTKTGRLHLVEEY